MITPEEWEHEYRALLEAYRAVEADARQWRARFELLAGPPAYAPLDAATKARIYQPVQEALVLARLAAQLDGVPTDPQAAP